MDARYPSCGSRSSLPGRDRDLRVLEDFLGGPVSSDASEDTGGVLVLQGEPGIGKTELVDVIVTRATAQGTHVLRSTGIESELDIGFAALTQLLGPAQRMLSRLAREDQVVLWAVLGHADSRAASPARVADAVRSLLLAAADEPAASTPGGACALLVVIDDLHWVDGASADVLRIVARTLDPPRTKMLLTERLAGRAHFDTAEHRLHVMRPLNDVAAEELLRVRFPTLSASVRSRVMAEAGGNPLALLELPPALQDHQHHVGGLPPTYLPLSQRLETLFGDRVRQLPVKVRELLLEAALNDLDRPLPLPGRTERLRIVAPAQRAGLVRLDRASGRMHFCHPLVRTTVVAVSTSRERRQAHRRLAARYQAGDEEAAWHLAAATVLPDEDVASLLERAAARTRRRGDAAGAVRALVRSAQLSQTPSQRSRRLAEAAYQGVAVEGDLTAATALLDRARRSDPGSVDTLQAAVVTGHALLTGAGDIHTAHQVLVGALESAGGVGTVDPRVYLEAVRTLGEVCRYAAEPRLWGPLGVASAGPPLGPMPEPPPWTRILVDPVRTAHGALPDLERELEGLETELDPAKVERVATAASYVDRVGTVRAPLQSLVDQARRGDAVTSGVLAATLLAFDDFRSGRWQRAREQADEGLGFADSHGLVLLTWPLKLTKALVAAAGGEHHDVRRTVDDMHSWAGPRGVGLVQHHAYWAAGLDALGRGDYEAAYRSLRRISAPGVLAPHLGHALWVALDLVEAAVHAGHGPAARAHVRAMQEADLAALSPRLALVVAGSEAIASSDLDPDLFEEALGLPEVSRWPFESARIRLAYGQRLRRARSVADARGHLATAAETFAGLGARPWAARADEELLATSPVKQSPARDRRVLTAQEHRVAVLAAEGRTNKDIAYELLISSRTVGAHLNHVFTKLDVSSRAGLHQALGSPIDSRHGHR